MDALRINRNLLRQQEAAAVRYFVGRLPTWCTPDQLTILSVAGAIVVALSLICCWLSGWFVLAAIGGLCLNWFGDSLDGALARAQKNERPRVGYLVDRCADLVSLTAMIIGLGLSPYLSVFSALMLLLTYYIHTIYVVLRNVVDGVHVIGPVGIGATEGRVLIGAWAAFAQLIGPNIVLLRVGDILFLDVFYVALFAGAMAMFVAQLIVDVRHVEDFERGHRILAANVVQIARGEERRTRGRGSPLTDDASLDGQFSASSNRGLMP